MKQILIISLILILGFKLNAQIFDTSDENYIEYRVFQLFNKYEHLSDFTDDGIKFSEDIKNSFENIFENKENKDIYNDLQKQGNYISVSKYAQIVQEYFPHGIETKIDTSNVRFLKPKIIQGDNYSIEVIADKYVVGITNENKIHREKLTAHFIIHFEYLDEEFDKFLIASITNKETLLKKTSDNKIRGFHLGVNLTPGISRLFLTGDYENYEKTNGFTLSNSVGFSIHYFLNSNLGVSTGINYTLYNTKTNSEYNNEQANNIERTDRDGDNYFLYVDSKIDELGKFIFLDIPLTFTYRHGLVDEISFYGSIGFITSLMQSAEFNVDGNASQSGYYPEFGLLIDDADLYNFGVIQYESNYPVEISKLLFLASVGAGVSIPVGNAGMFNAGIEYRQNISSLEYNSAAYRDDFVSINGIPKSSWLQFITISIP